MYVLARSNRCCNVIYHAYNFLALDFVIELYHDSKIGENNIIIQAKVVKEA